MHDPQRAERGFTIHSPIDGVQTMDTERFTLSWRPKAVEALGEVGLAGFQLAMSALMSQVRDEHSGDPERLARAAQNRAAAVEAFATVFNTPGSAITFTDRNTRYTNVDGHFMADAVNDGQPAEVPFGRVDHIQNPLNYPE